MLAIFKVPLGWGVPYYISQGWPSTKSSSINSTVVAPWQSTANGGLQFHFSYRGGYGWYIDSAHYLVLPHHGGNHHGYCRFYQWHQGCTAFRAVHLPLRGSSGGQAPGYLLEPQRLLHWLSTLILFTLRHWLWGALRWVRPRNIPKVLPFFLQEVMNSFPLPRAAVVVLLGFSKIAGDTPHSGQLIHFRYSFPLFPILLARVGGSASWSTQVVRVTESFPSLAGLILQAADRSSLISASGMADGTVR